MKTAIISLFAVLIMLPQSSNAAEDVMFIWPETQECPGLDNEEVWQCYNLKLSGEDIAIHSQAINEIFPGITLDATEVGVRGSFFCNDQLLAVSVDGNITHEIVFEKTFSQLANGYVSSAGLTFPNSYEIYDGQYTGQLLACDTWPYEISRVEGGERPLRIEFRTNQGSSFDIALLIPDYWADGDRDDNRVVENPPDSEPPGTGGCDVTFSDVPCDFVFHDDIEWLANSGITKGCNPPDNTRFCPEDFVTRGQMAAFLVRGLDLPPRGYSDYSTYMDVGSTHIFFDEVGILGAEGITKGCNPPDNTYFCPNDFVTRGQMAAFLVRALGLPVSTTDAFVDDDRSVFERDIQALASSGITRGCNPPENDRFCPNDPVTRGQMAAFLNRALAP